MFSLPAFLATMGLILLPAMGGIAFVLASEQRHGRIRIPNAIGAVLRPVALSLAWCPAVALAGFVLLVATAWLHFGAMPTEDLLDPPTYPWVRGPVPMPQPHWFYSVRSALTVVGTISIVGVVITPGLLALARAAGHPVGAVSRWTYACCWAVVIALLVANPGDLATWMFVGL